MSSKLPLFSLLLVACSGPAGATILGGHDAGEPTAAVAPGPEGADAAQKDAPHPQDDSGPAETPDASDAWKDVAAPDASVLDAHASDVEAPTSRYGVTLSGDGRTAAAAQLPISIGGQPSVTLEAWYRLDEASDRGAIMMTPWAYCAVTTGGPATIHCCAHTDTQGSQSCVVGQVAAQGVWYHVAWVLSAERWSLFVDGAKQGEVRSPFQAYPKITSYPIPTPGSHLFLGAEAEAYYSDHASFCTIDEFRLSFSALYGDNFAPPKHLDAPGALNLLLDEGVGTVSGSATLYGGVAWTPVSR